MLWWSNNGLCKKIGWLQSAWLGMICLDWVRSSNLGHCYHVNLTTFHVLIIFFHQPTSQLGYRENFIIFYRNSNVSWVENQPQAVTILEHSRCGTNLWSWFSPLPKHFNLLFLLGWEPATDCFHSWFIISRCGTNHWLSFSP